MAYEKACPRPDTATGQMEKVSLSDRKSNEIMTDFPDARVKVADARQPKPEKKIPLTVRGVPLGVVLGGRYNFNNLQIEVESIEYARL